jgi:hypothetical protein
MTRSERVAGLSVMRDTGRGKLDVMLRSRPIEPMDPNLVARIIATTKTLQKIKKPPAFHAPKRLDHLTHGK